MSEEACSRDHGRGHTVTDEHDDVLGEALLRDGEDGPLGDGFVAAVVLQHNAPLARLVESDVAVGLGLDVHERRRVGVLGKEVLQANSGVRRLAIIVPRR